ncbi:MAG: type II toxin-antitoxin system RelE/ParE family toxin [Kiloniellales bacterium]
MIRGIRHKGLREFHEKGRTTGLDPKQIKRIRAILSRLDASGVPQDMDLPGLRLHPLKGQLAGFWAVDVSGNRRIVFRIEAGEVFDVDLIDYH